MSDQLLAYDVTVPATPGVQTVQTFDVGFPPRSVVGIDIRVPPGPNGMLGFRLTTGGVQVVPYTTGDWIVANDDHFTWALPGLLDSGAWQVQAYNQGNFAHTIYLLFHVTPNIVANNPAGTLNPQVAALTGGT